MLLFGGKSPCCSPPWPAQNCKRSESRNEDGFARKEQDGANLANFKVRAPENCRQGIRRWFSHKMRFLRRRTVTLERVSINSIIHPRNCTAVRESFGRSLRSHRPRHKPRLREFCSHGQEEVVSNNRKTILATWSPLVWQIL